jgi:hypothetical protein
LQELVKWADVVVEDFTPGVTEKLGLGYEELKETNPLALLHSWVNPMRRHTPIPWGTVKRK